MDYAWWIQLNNNQLQTTILSQMTISALDNGALTKDSAMDIAREILKEYPRQLQYFGDWFEMNWKTVLERINDSV